MQDLRDSLGDKIAAKLKYAPDRPPLSTEGVEAALADAKRQQSSTSMTMAAEKTLLRDMQNLRKMKETIATHAAFQAEMDDMKAKRADVAEKLKVVNPSITELRAGLRRLDALERARAANPGMRIDPTHIVSSELPIGAEHMPRLIGKAGAGLREIEAACGVVLEIDDPSRVREREGEAGKKGAASAPPGQPKLKITGIPSGIDAALARIGAITSQVETTIPCSAAVASYLTTRGGEALRVAELAYAVRVRLVREEGVAQVRGLPAGTLAFQRAVEEAEASKVVVTVDSRSLPSLIGKGGANLKKLREDTGCEVELGERVEGAATTTISLIAFGPGSSSALSLGTHALAAMRQEFEEGELILPMPRDAISWLVGKGGERIQAWQKEAGVYARIARKEADGTVSGSTSASVESLGLGGTAVVLRAPAPALARAKPMFDALMAEYRRCNVTLVMAAAQMRAVVGPSGATVKKLRAETGCNIDADEASTPGEKEEAPKAERGRPNRADDIGLAPGQAVVHVAGEADKVPAAVAAVQALLKAYREGRVPASTPMINALMRSKGELVRAIQDATGAALDIVRDPAAAAAEVARRAAKQPSAAPAAAAKGRAAGPPTVAPSGRSLPPPPTAGYAGVIVASGTEAAVAAAVTRLEALLASKQERTIVMPDASALGDFVGKGGAAIKSLKEETNVEVEILKAEGAILLVGTPEAMAIAADRVADFFAKYAKEHASVQVDKSQLPAFIGKGGSGLKALEAETGTTIRVSNDGEVTISGAEAAVIAARARIITQCKLDKASESMSVDPAIVGRLIGRGACNVRKLEEAHGVSIGVETATGLITLRGEPAGIAAARAALRKLAREASKAEVEVDVPADRVGTIIGPKGARLRALEAETGCTIDVPRERTAAVVIVKARGSEAAAARAKVVLTAIADSKAVRTLTRATSVANTLRGRDAALLERIQADCSVAVSVWGAEPVEADEDGPAAPAAVPSVVSGAVLFITGASDAAVGRAVAAIDRLLVVRFPDAYATLVVPAGLGAGLVQTDKAEGSDALVVGDLLERFGVGASYEKEGSYVVVWGPAKGVTGAKAAIAAAASAFASRHSEVLVDSWMLPALIGKGGASLKALEAEAKAAITIDRDSKGIKTVVRLAASSAAGLEAAVAAVQARAATLARTRVLLRMPPSSFGSLIGKAGAVIRALQDETGASFDLDRDCGLVTVRGPTEAVVTGAVERVVAIVAEGGATAKHATEAEVAALTVALPELSREVKDAAIKAGLGGDYTIVTENGVLTVKASSAEAVAAGVRAVRGALDASKKHLQEAVVPVAAAAVATMAVPRSVPGLVPGGPEAPEGKMSKNARQRAKRKAAAAAGVAEEEEEEEEAPAPAPVVPTPARAVPIVQAPTARALAVAVVAPVVTVHAPVPAAAAAAPAPAVRAPVVAAAPVAAPAPARRAAAPAPANLSTDEMLAQLLGTNYKELLAMPGGKAVVPTPAPVAARPAAVAVAPPASPVKTRPAGGPPPGFPATPQHPPVATPSKPAAAAAAAAAASRSWGSKPAAGAGAAPAEADSAATLAALSISHPSIPAAAPVPISAKVSAAAPAPAKRAGAARKA